MVGMGRLALPRLPGSEPGRSAIPTEPHARNWYTRQESNLHKSVPKTDAFPVRLRVRIYNVNIVEKIVDGLLDEGQTAVIQFVSPNNTFFWYTGTAERWSQNEQEAQPLEQSEAERTVAHLEKQSPEFQGKLGVIPIPGYAARYGASGRI